MRSAVGRDSRVEALLEATRMLNRQATATATIPTASAITTNPSQRFGRAAAGDEEAAGFDEGVSAMSRSTTNHA
jgi:hypothetical protein